jgi:hypothetical protein
VGDIQSLVQQQVQLTRNEIVTEVRERLVGWAVISAGIGIAILGVIMLCLTASRLLHWGLSPPESDPASLPLWACYGVVSATLLAVGGGVAWLGSATASDVSSGPSLAGVFRRTSQ